VCRVPRDLAQDGHIEGLALATRGGILIDYNFLGRGLEYARNAADKDYRFSAIVLGTVRSVPFRVKIVEPQLSASTPRQGDRLP
jgi:hypothetical protein